MANPKKTNYVAGWQLLKNISDKKFRNTKNFTPQQKAFITRALNSLRAEGLLETDYSGKTASYKLPYKYRKSKKEKIKGFPAFKGSFVRGVAKTAKMRGNKIIGEFYDIIFIPLEFEDLEEIISPDELEFSDIVGYVREIVAEAMMPYYADLKVADYLTILTGKGWEYGRGAYKKKENKKGRAIANGASKAVKIDEISKFIARLLIKSWNRYAIGLNLISGINLYKFKKRK